MISGQAITRVHVTADAGEFHYDLGDAQALAAE
jgi:hypothetical protein